MNYLTQSRKAAKPQSRKAATQMQRVLLRQICNLQSKIYNPLSPHHRRGDNAEEPLVNCRVQRVEQHRKAIDS